MNNKASSQNAHNKRKIVISLIITIFCLALIGGGIVGYKFIKHEQGQNERINNLQSQVSLLQAAIDKAEVEWGDGYNYLAIGNSITKHPLASYWWAEDGMAASTADKDYFHLVSSYLEQSYDDVAAYAFNGSAWEVQTNDRYEVLSMGVWDGYLSEEIDLVTIQLSENVSDTITFESDFKEMIEYVVRKCPQAQIVVVDDFWSDEKSEMKKSAVDKLNAEGLEVDWVDLREIRGKSEYQAGMGTIVYDADGGEHIIEHDGVAIHPGDLGMEYYAEKIKELIK